MEAISVVALASAITMFGTVLLIFVLYWINNTVLKNLVAAQRNQELASTMLQVVHQLNYKREVENENKSA